MVIIIAGASCVGKTYLSQKLLEKIHFPYYSIDHLKMGLIRNKMTTLTPYDDDKLTGYLWGIVKEVIKTAIENKQNLIIEGCYIPFDYRKYFDKEYLKDIIFIGLCFSNNYINNHFEEIIKYQNVIENRLTNDITLKQLITSNEYYYNGFTSNNEKMNVIDNDYSKTIDKIIDDIIKRIL